VVTSDRDTKGQLIFLKYVKMRQFLINVVLFDAVCGRRCETASVIKVRTVCVNNTREPNALKEVCDNGGLARFF
jgi:hypothetical protein